MKQPEDLNKEEQHVADYLMELKLSDRQYELLEAQIRHALAILPGEAFSRLRAVLRDISIAMPEDEDE